MPHKTSHLGDGPVDASWVNTLIVGRDIRHDDGACSEDSGGFHWKRRLDYFQGWGLDAEDRRQSLSTGLLCLLHPFGIPPPRYTTSCDPSYFSFFS